MGFEGPRKPPQFVIDAAMKEDPTLLREISSKGGKAAAEKKAERKRLAAIAENQKQDQLTAEREAFEEHEAFILKRDAIAHGLATAPPKED